MALMTGAAPSQRLFYGQNYYNPGGYFGNFGNYGGVGGYTPLYNNLYSPFPIASYPNVGFNNYIYG